MRIPRFSFLLALIVGANLLSTSSAYAQLDIGRRVTFAAPAEGYVVFLNVEPNNSYCCEIDNLSVPLVFVGTVTLASTTGSPVATVRSATNDEPLTWSRLCFSIPNDTSTIQASIPTTYGVLPPGINVSITCKETTLYGGFNTSVTDFNFLELSNTLTPVPGVTSIDRTVSAKIYAVNTVPEPDVTLINGSAASIAAGSRTDVDIHSVAGTGAFGPLKVTHTAAPGALKAVLNQYNITSTSPLDFAPVAQEVFKTRSELAGGGNWD